MPTDKQTLWVLDRHSLLAEVKLDAADRDIIAPGVDDILRAVAQVVPPQRVVTDGAKGTPSTSAPLLIAGKKYHLNVSDSFKSVLLGALTILAKGFVLDQTKLIESGVSFGAQGMITVLSSLTKLTERQQLAVTALCDIVREKKLPNYHPSTKELAKRLKWKPGELEATLKPIAGRVVANDKESQTWSLIF